MRWWALPWRERVLYVAFQLALRCSRVTWWLGYKLRTMLKGAP